MKLTFEIKKATGSFLEIFQILLSKLMAISVYLCSLGGKNDSILDKIDLILPETCCSLKRSIMTKSFSFPKHADKKIFLPSTNL